MSLVDPQQSVKIALFWTANNVLKWLAALSTLLLEDLDIENISHKLCTLLSSVVSDGETV